MLRAADLALSLVGSPPSELETLVERARLILETRPGTMPWAPRIGVDLDDLAQGAASPGRMARARNTLEDALRAGLPEGALQDVEVRVADVEAATAAGAPIPFAERALASAGARATLEVRVRLRCRGTTVTLASRMEG
jgi:hypothetical protein